MDELLISDGSEYTEEDLLNNPYLQDSEAWGAADGTTILPITPTPSVVPDPVADSDLDDEKIVNLTEELKRLNENIEGLSENEQIREDLSSNQDQTEEQETGEEQETEEQDSEVTIETIAEDLEQIEGILQSISDQQIIASKNESLFSEFTLGFLVAFFFGFVVYLFLSRIR